MATFVLIHGAGDSAFYWPLLAPELRVCGHDVVAPDLPCEDDSAGLPSTPTRSSSLIG
jgi:alpha-beta hydrolase superfamily lysophospholipase